MIRFLPSFFRRKKQVSLRTPAQRKREVEEDLFRKMEQARSRLDRFLITRSVSQGEVKKTKEWTLVKTGESLFRLESSDLSVLVNTRPFLVEKGGKISGLLRMDESILCRLLHDSAPLSRFIATSDDLSESSRALLVRYPALQGGMEHPLHPGVEDLLQWSNFDLYQVIARTSLNSLAHLILHASKGLREKLLGLLSLRVKEALVQELDVILSPGSDPALNPHSRVRSLVHYGDALEEVGRTMAELLPQMELKKSRESGQKRLPEE